MGEFGVLLTPSGAHANYKNCPQIDLNTCTHGSPPSADLCGALCGEVSPSSHGGTAVGGLNTYQRTDGAHRFIITQET